MDSYNKLRTQVNKYIKKYPTPSAKENIENFKKLYLLRSENPESEDFRSLREQIIISNGGFAMKYAIIYCKKVNDSDLIDDLFQQAQIGITEAVDRFDPYVGVNFTTFAYFYVRKCIIDYIKRNKVISVNRNIARYIKHISEIHDQLLQENQGFMPTIEEIKLFLLKERGLDVKTDVITQLLNLIDLNSSSELSFTTDNFDNISFDEKYENILLLQLSIIKDLAYISPEMLDLVKLRFGIGYDRPYTLGEIKKVRELSQDDIVKLIEVSNLYV